MPTKLSLIGKTFGRLKVVADAPSKNGNSMALCVCDCGAHKTVENRQLNYGCVRSCGCLHQDLKSARTFVHGHAYSFYGKVSRTYSAWRCMKGRCRNKNDPAYKNYGARGITVCDRWINFENFLADMGESQKDTFLERINNNGNYEPSNCKWATRKQQNRNKRNNHLVTVNGVTCCVAEMCERLNLSQKMVNSRLSKGWSEESAFLIPKRIQGSRHLLAPLVKA